MRERSVIYRDDMGRGRLKLVRRALHSHSTTRFWNSKRGLVCFRRPPKLDRTLIQLSACLVSSFFMVCLNLSYNITIVSPIMPVPVAKSNMLPVEEIVRTAVREHLDPVDGSLVLERTLDVLGRGSARVRSVRYADCQADHNPRRHLRIILVRRLRCRYVASDVCCRIRGTRSRYICRQARKRRVIRRSWIGQS